MELAVSCLHLRACILIMLCWFGFVAGSVCPANWAICSEKDFGRRECCDVNHDCHCDRCCEPYFNHELGGCPKLAPKLVCSKPWNGEPSDSWRECVANCPTAKFYHRYDRRCHNYCDWKERSALSPASVIVIVLLFAGFLGAIAMLSSRLLEVPKRVALTWGSVAAVVVFVCGLIPASTQYPMYCAEVSWHGHAGLMIFPITFLGSAASFSALAVGIAWMTTKPRSSLATRSAIYLVSVTLCNFCGLIGILHMSCHQEFLFGLPFYIAWIISSFITNLVLQKIVVMRAALVDKSKLPKCLQCIFCTEVILALLLFGFSMFLAIAIATTDHEKNQKEHEELSEEEQRQKEEEGKAALQMTALAVILFTLLFILFDLVFSIASSMAMHSGLKKIEEQRPTVPAGQGETEAGGLLKWPSALDRAIFFAKVNLFLVMASVATTSLFYFAFILMTAVIMGDTDYKEVQRRMAFLFIAWLLDSLFNDACVVFVGFGPTSEALTTIGEAAAADIIGAPTVHMGAPAHQIAEGTVTGTVVAAHPQHATDGKSSKQKG